MLRGTSTTTVLRHAARDPHRSHFSRSGPLPANKQVVFLPVALGLLLNTYAEGVTRRLSPYTPLL